MVDFFEDTNFVKVGGSDFGKLLRCDHAG